MEVSKQVSVLYRTQPNENQVSSRLDPQYIPDLYHLPGPLLPSPLYPTAVRCTFICQTPIFLARLEAC